MGSKKRQSGSSIKERLFKEFFRYPFFQAVNLLENLLPGKKRIGSTLTPEDEAVRFSVKPGLAFPPSEISDIKHHEDDEPINMEVAFMGLVGPSSTLPYCYNEQAIERVYEKDYGLTAFYDIFHHRLISLFYLAWKKHQLAASYQHDEKDKISSYFLSLAGMGTRGLQESLGLPDNSLPHFFSGLLSRGVPSASTIESVIENFSGTAVNVQQFIEQLLSINPEDRTQIGLANGQLGVDTVCGNYAYESQSKFRVNLGPVKYDDFIHFMPGGKMLNPTFSLIRYIVGIQYEFEIRIYLNRDEVPMCVLGSEGPAPSLLGCLTWIRSPDVAYPEDPYVTFQECDA